MGADVFSQPGHPGARPTPGFRSSILMKLTALIIALVVVTAGVLIWAGYSSASAILRQQVAERLSLIAAARQAMLLDFAGRQEERVTRLARRPRLRSLLESLAEGKTAAAEGRAEIERILRDARDSVQTFREIWIVDTAGRPIASTDGRFGERIPSEARSLLTGRPGRHQLVAPFSSGEGYSSVLSEPITTREGRVLGALAVLVDVSPLAKYLQNTSGLGQTGEVIVATRKADRILVLLPSRIGVGVREYPPSAMPALARAAAGREGFVRHQITGGWTS